MRKSKKNHNVVRILPSKKQTCSSLGGLARPPAATDLPSRWLRKNEVISSQLAIKKMARDQVPREASKKALAERM